MLMHELGHSYNGEHCNNDKCLMKYMDNLVELDNIGLYYCGDCAETIYGEIGVNPESRRKAIATFVKEYGLDNE